MSQGAVDGARVRRLLVLTGCALVVVAAVSLFVGAGRDIDGYPWSSSAALPVDGGPHALTLPEHRTAVVWTYDGTTSSPSCRFSDARTRRALPLSADSDGYWRSGGPAAGYRVDQVFATGSGHVTARCSGTRDASPAYVEKKPFLPPVLDGAGTYVIGIPGLCLVGLLGVGVVAVRDRSRTRAHLAPDVS